MKAIHLKKHILYSLVFLFSFFACQEETVDIENQSEETIEANSTLANLISFTTANDGSIDNIIDFANCLEIQLPVTVIINNIEIIIDSEDDYQTIEDIFDEYDNDNDAIEIVYPITIILSDYTTIEINNEADLVALIEDCNGENEADDDIECIDFQYPITLSVYDSNFQVAETVTVENDEDLYNFIENLEGGVLASINFPVTMVLANGETIEINNNQELEATITEAEDTCDEDDDNDWNDDDFECTEEAIELALKDCEWHIELNNALPNLVADFNNDYTLQIININTDAVEYEGEWSISSENNTITLTLETTWEDINGTWEITECEEGYFVLTQGNDIMMLGETCEDNETSFECFGFIVLEQECDDDDNGYVETVLALNVVTTDQCTNLETTQAIYNTYLDAQNETNVTNINLYEPVLLESQTLYIRIDSFESNQYEIQELEIIVEDCNDNITEIENYLLECFWEPINYNGSNEYQYNTFVFYEDGTLDATSIYIGADRYWSISTNANGDVVINFIIQQTPFLDAFEGEWIVLSASSEELQLQSVEGNNQMTLARDCGTYYVECMGSGHDLCDDGSFDGITTFNLTQYVNNTSCSIDTYQVYTSLEDAQNETNSISNIETFTNTSNPQMVFYAIYEGTELVYINPFELVVEDCNNNLPFNCFDNFYIEECRLDDTDAIDDAIFNLNANTIGLVDCSVSFTATFHETLTEAETNTNAIATTETYQSVSTTIYLRIEAANGEYEVYEVVLNVENCDQTCTQQELDGYLQECIWNVVSLNGSDDLIEYNLHFENSGTVVIYTDSVTIDALWSTTQTSNGVLLELAGINGSNIQAISGDWTIIECEQDRLVMLRNQDEMVLEQDCN